jgi:hypothetical protein
VPRFSLLDPAAPPLSSISADGSEVFFQNTSALTPGALNHVCVYEVESFCESEAVNVYEYENGNVYLLSDGQDTHSVLRSTATGLLGAGADGNNVFITSADPLSGVVGESGQQHVYDVRVNGGFSPVSSPTSCSSGCQGAGTEAPVLGPPATATLTGMGNVSPPAASSKLTPAQLKARRLADALRVCRRVRSRHRRSVCEARARKLYKGAVSARKRHRHAVRRVVR